MTIPATAWQGVLAAFVAASSLMAGAWPTIVAKVARDNADRASTVVGITVAAGLLGCIVAPPAMGWLFGSVQPALAMAAPALPLPLASGLAAWRTPPTPPSS